MSAPILDIRDLRVAFGTTDILHGVSLQVTRGEIVGLVGESGSGKTTLVQGALRLLGPPGVITGGDVSLAGHDVLAAPPDTLRKLWWSTVSLVPQQALNALNPMLTIGAHFDDTLAAHGIPSASERRRRARESMALVDLAPETLDAHPHMLSGGMRQRVAIALALVLDPKLVVFDEPTTALDVVVEREILDRIRALQAARGFAAVFITHDLSLLATIADRIAVLYAGTLVEVAPAAALGGPQSHPYTRGLLHARPPNIGEERAAVPIPGAPPRPGTRTAGCVFAPRCPVRQAVCSDATPPTQTRANHQVACIHAFVGDTP